MNVVRVIAMMCRPCFNEFNRWPSCFELPVQHPRAEGRDQTPTQAFDRILGLVHHGLCLVEENSEYADKKYGRQCLYQSCKKRQRYAPPDSFLVCEDI